MNKIIIILTALLLSACASQPSQLAVPNQIKHKNKSYQMVAGQDLGSVARYVYLSQPDTLEKWQSQIELLLDRNEQHRDIKERITLRERIYRNTEVSSFKLTPIKDDKTKKYEGLKGYVIYPPTENDPYWQVNMMMGKEMIRCGFVQFQYSQKVKKSRHLSKEKILQHLQKYLIAKEMKNLEKMDWQWHCQDLK
ncbi:MULTISPECIES: hypothetical protein [Pasteurellaceae]|uniref:6-phosphofructokinase n=1 Tax=Rodentibacter genomosp. 1 TaxID=1908264 RepID=A0A1V3J1M9_9PAST|nr:hypothetical protein [Rodentibacter genomosp. 1]MBF0752425.1 hypothetical protein [Pasteurella sp. 19428wF3_WM03]OOF48699.1 hypothetical protein BKK54_10740 [Rodentibacter genomosp. 1]